MSNTLPDVPGALWIAPQFQEPGPNSDAYGVIEYGGTDWGKRQPIRFGMPAVREGSRQVLVTNIRPVDWPPIPRSLRLVGMKVYAYPDSPDYLTSLELGRGLAWNGNREGVWLATGDQLSLPRGSVGLVLLDLSEEWATPYEQEEA
jgi:hypothetical protein